MESNEQLEAAFNYIAYTSVNVFLTGKAGTGKTTFLNRVRQEVMKNIVVVAPTAVAAINAGGVTIHSQFNLPLGVCGSDVLRSDNERRRIMNFSKVKINVLRSVDLLVIDEISMVRADVLDAVDEVLRRYRDYAKPFGGVQLLVIGDLLQLAPVAVLSEMDILMKRYNSIYFFDSKAFNAANFLPIELTKIYRQKDQEFIDILENVRSGNVSENVLEQLNERYKPSYDFNEKGRIALTSHVRNADSVNYRMINALEGDERIFEAEITGEFADGAFPTDAKLKLKVGAQVMFVKNDVSITPPRYYNGKVGTVTKIGSTLVEVSCEGEDGSITVSPDTWTNKRYEIDKITGQTVEVEIGTFTQYPLRLAWAITIHKSQGLTFDKVVIDAADCFAHGQAYVALSRCRTFDGLMLSSRLATGCFICDGSVKTFCHEASEFKPFEGHLEQSKDQYRAQILENIYSLDQITALMREIRSLFANNLMNVYQNDIAVMETIIIRFGTKLSEMANKFITVIKQHIFNGVPLKNDITLQQRLTEGALYFKENVIDDAKLFLSLSDAVIDNKEVAKRVDDRRKRLITVVKIKSNVYDMAIEGFSIEGYLKAKNRAACEGVGMEKKGKRVKSVNVLHDEALTDDDVVQDTTLSRELYDILVAWRREKSSEEEVPAYIIMQNKVLKLLSESMPIDPDQLSTIKGIGKHKIETYGDELLSIIINFTEENGLLHKLDL
ncbi:MAG: AAA family ATPase [Rikenellaceae bacterium]